MRSLKRNKRELWYANYERTEPVYDEYMNEIGHKVIYSEPIRRDLNISAGRGEASDEVFGKSLDYSRVLSPDTPDTPINEFSVIWIGIKPEYENGEHKVAWNHIVAAVRDSKNVVQIAVKEVDISL